MAARLELTAAQVVAFRRRTGGLDERVASGAASLRAAAWAGLQDSMPRAALLSIHARLAATAPGTWEDPSLCQVWGPRYSAYVVADADRALFTLSRLTDDPAARRQADELADRIEAFLDGRRLDCREVGRGLGRHPSSLRYAAPSGRLVLRWDGARQPTLWTVPVPEIAPAAARLEVARRFLHVFGPTTPEAFAEWLGFGARRGRAVFDDLAGEITSVGTPVGEAWILASDEELARTAPAGEPAPARRLPSGDAFFLLWGADRSLLVPDAARRAELWTSRVWPGAVLVDGEVAGTWRRAGAVVTIAPWRRLPAASRAAIESEATSFPIPGIDREIRVEW